MKIMKYKIILILLTIALASSIILSLDKTSTFCNTGSGCETVQTSQYAYTFGIKNSEYGIVIFAILIATTLAQLHKRTDRKYKFLAMGLLIGSIVSLWFIYLQVFVIHAYCEFCLVVDISTLLATGIFLGMKK